MLLMIFLPRLWVSAGLLWMGCRFLMATLGYDNIITNAIALEFILQVPSIVYAAMVPKRSQVEVSRTYLIPEAKNMKVSASAFLSTYWWGFLGVSWVLAYIYFFQTVLIDYNWDVQQVCHGYLVDQAAG